jgi:hypothetical protein
MNEVDQFAKHQLKLTHYVRYVDDITVFGQDAQPCGDLLRKRGHDSLRRSNQLRFNQFVLLAEPFLCVWKIIRKLK